MRFTSPLLAGAAVLAAFACGPAVQAQNAIENLLPPHVPDPLVARWLKHAGWRLDEALRFYPVDLPPPAGVRGRICIAESTLQVDPRGRIQSWAQTRSCGDPLVDRAMQAASRQMTILQLPPLPAALVGRPVVLQVAFVAPPSFGPRGGLDQMTYGAALMPSHPVDQPGEVVSDLAPVVVSATR